MSSALALRTTGVGKLSAGYRAHVSAHKRALGSTMAGCQMTADPYQGADNAASLAWRACQYAAILAGRAGRLQGNARDYTATYLGAGRVSLVRHTADGAGDDIDLTIPERIMSFQPSVAIAHEPEPAAIEPAPRCEHTADMLAIPSARPAGGKVAPLALSPPLKSASGRPRARAAKRAKMKTIYFQGKALRIAI